MALTGAVASTTDDDGSVFGGGGALTTSFDRLDHAFGVLPETKTPALAVSYRLFGVADPTPVVVALSSTGLLIDPIAQDPPATITLPYGRTVALDAPDDPDGVLLLAGAPEDRFTVLVTPVREHPRSEPLAPQHGTRERTRESAMASTDATGGRDHQGSPTRWPPAEASARSPGVTRRSTWTTPGSSSSEPA
jgi:hypothetical protein